MLGKARGLVPTSIRRSYALKFGIALLLLGLSIAAIGLVATAQITDSVEENALDDQETLAAQGAAAINNWNDQNERRTASTANTPVVENGDANEIQSYLNALQLDLSGQVADIHYVDQESHELLASTNGDAITLEELGFPDADAIDGDLSAVEIGRTDAYATDDDAAVVSYYVSTSGPAETAIVMSFDLEHLMTDFGGAVDGETVTLAVDRDGQLVLDDTLTGTGRDARQTDFVESRFLQEYADDHGILAEAFESDNATHSGAAAFDGTPGTFLENEAYDFESDGYVAAYHGTEMDWVVVRHTSTAEAYGFVNAVNQYGTLATLGGVVSIGLIGAVLGRNTSQSIDRLTGKVREMEEGDLDVDFSTARIDNIGRLYDGFGSMRDELRLQIEEAETARAEAEAERERVEQLNAHIEAKADEYSRVMQTAADGDLTARMDPESENEAISTIGEEFNEMLTEIEATVEHLNEFATDVATASEQVTASSEEVRSASEEVSESVQEISDGADRQHQSLQSIDTEMNGLSTTTEQIAASSNDVAELAERTAHTGRDGRQAAREAIDACDDLESEQQRVVDEFEQLRTQVDQITDLTDTIAEIAEQTNMLALNANIEASRSNSTNDSEGFSAVAAEVKQLSQDVKDAAEEINERLEAVEEQTDRSAAEVDRTGEEIERVIDLVSNTVDALDEIAEYARNTNDGVQEISAATEEQAASTQEVVAMVDQVATISEETTAEAENVAAAAEEQTTALTEVTASADGLSKQATVLSEALDRFETGADGSGEVAAIDLEADDAAEAAGADTASPVTGDDADASADTGGDADDGDLEFDFGEGADARDDGNSAFTDDGDSASSADDGDTDADGEDGTAEGRGDGSTDENADEAFEFGN